MLARTHGMTATWLAIAALSALAVLFTPRAATAQSSLDAAIAAHADDAASDVATDASERAAVDGESLVVHRDAALDVAPTDALSTAPPDASTTEARAPPAPRRRLPAGQVARVAFGLCALFALAILAAHPRVRAFEKSAGFGMFATAALPFIALGAIARHPVLGVLSPSVVADLRPVMDFGLGWIGFRVGAEFDVRSFDRITKGTGLFVTTATGLTLIATGMATMLVLVPFHWPLSSTLIRDALLIGACAAVSAPSGARALERAGALTAEASKAVRASTRLDDAVPMVVLAIVTAIFRPLGRERFALPPLGWVFLQVGMGACLGFLLLASRSAARSDNERSALTFGGVAFSAGMAQYLGFSPLVVAFCAGVIVASLREREGDDFAQLLLRLERPIYLTFFAVVGATWSVASAQVLVLLAAYVAARTAAKLLAPRVRPLPGAPSSLVAIALQPSSVVAVAVVVTARNLYPDFDPLYESVVLFGALIAELFTQLFVAAWKRREPPPPELELSDAPADTDRDDDEVLL